MERRLRQRRLSLLLILAVLCFVVVAPAHAQSVNDFKVDGAVYWDFFYGPNYLPLTTTMPNDLIIVEGITWGTSNGTTLTVQSIPPTTTSAGFNFTAPPACLPGQPIAYCYPPQPQAQYQPTNAKSGVYNPVATLSFSNRAYHNTNCNFASIVYYFQFYAQSSAPGLYVTSFVGGRSAGVAFAMFALNTGSQALTPSNLPVTFGCQLGSYPATVPTVTVPTLPSNTFVFSY